MKKVSAILWMILFISCASGQTLLSFCTAIDPQNGYCVFSNTKFISQPDSTSARIYIKISNAEGFASAKVTFKIFSVDKKGEEMFSRSLMQNVEKDWTTCWQNERFDSPGTYLIKVYNDTDLLICSKSFELIKYW